MTISLNSEIIVECAILLCEIAIIITLFFFIKKKNKEKKRLEQEMVLNTKKAKQESLDDLLKNNWKGE